MTKATNPEIQAKLATALLVPSIYGTAVDRVEMLETHISYVFLAGPHAYKVKKAVNLGFLDFRTLTARRHYCEEEIRLNRRFAPALYLEVISITGSVDHPILGGEGPPIEYAVKMNRFSQDQLLDRLLARDQLETEHIDHLARTVAAFHASIAVALGTDVFGTPEAVQRPALENFSQIELELSLQPDRAELDFLKHWTEHHCDSLQDVFADRQRSGFVRECHGDLHSGNIALVDNEATLFDCLEFNENLRWIDVMNEVGFLVMDLQEKKHPPLAHRFLNDYLQITGDYAGLRVLRFYMAYRAIVRAKIDIMRARQPHLNAAQRTGLLTEYRAYIALAKSYAATPRSAIIITHGLSGSGKTTATQSLLETIGAIRVRSDVERKRLHGLPGNAHTASHVGEGLYSSPETELIYRRLLDLARLIVRAGYTVIVDATFIKRCHRDAFHELAGANGVPFVILDVTADEALMRSRIQERLARQTDVSEADGAVLEHQLVAQEPLQEDEMPWVFSYDSTVCDREGDVRLWEPLIKQLALQSEP